jgi:hypothetical protein
MNQVLDETALLGVPWRTGRSVGLRRVLFPLLFVFAGGLLGAEQRQAPIDDVTGNYHFLSPQDRLAILEEEGNLSGYLDVSQGEDESDALLSYPVANGSRQNERVEFKTGKIHQKYYRFAGVAQRGQGKKDTDPDYLRLVGDLEIVTFSSETGQESVERRQVVFQRMEKGEVPEE